MEALVQNTHAEEEKEAQTKSGSQGLGSVGSIGGAIIGYAVVRFIPFGVLVQLAAGTLAGCLIGLIPFFMARKMHVSKLAPWALSICAVSGLISGLLLAIPMSFVFVVIILVRSHMIKVRTTVDACGSSS